MPRAVKPAPEVEPEVEETDTAETEAPEVEPEVEEVQHRFETFEATRPDGTVVIVERNIDTGEQTVTDKD